MMFLRNIDHSTDIQQMENKLNSNVACFVVISDEKNNKDKYKYKDKGL